MTARNLGAAGMKAAFRRRFRREPVGLIYSRTAAGEGRLISAAEAARFIDDVDRAIDRAAIWLGRSVVASFVAPVMFGFVALRYNLPILGLVAVASLLSWIVVWCFLRWQRVRLERQLWVSVERRPIVPALARRERVKRGYSMALWQWLWILPVTVLFAAIRAPDDILPDRWRLSHAVLQVVVILAAAFGLGAVPLFKLLRKWRRSR